jgi:Dna[CI] antecedent DciA-like protein
MPKRPYRNKQTVRPGSAPKTVGDLMSARLPALAQRALSAPETSEWQVALLKAFGTDLANKVNRCTLESGTLTVIAESSAWAARLRFSLAELEPRLNELVPGYRTFAVQVRPRKTAPARR